MFAAVADERPLDYYSHILIVTFYLLLNYNEYMTLLILLSLLLPVPATATPAYCEEVALVIMEAVEDGVLSINEANEFIARCARAADL